MGLIGRIVSYSMLVLLIAALLAAYGVYKRLIDVPERYDPFAHYDVRAEPGPFTPYKRWRAMHDPQRCAAALAQSGLVYREMADSTGAGGCELKNVVRITQADDVRFSVPFLATCPLALASPTSNIAICRAPRSISSVNA